MRAELTAAARLRATTASPPLIRPCGPPPSPKGEGLRAFSSPARTRKFFVIFVDCSFLYTMLKCYTDTNDKEHPMDNVKILEVKQSIFASNDEQAAALRQD